MAIESLRLSFLEYAKRVNHKLFSRQSGRSLKLLHNRQELLALTADLEVSEEFRKLLLETCDHFHEESHSKNEQIWKQLIGNFFRRSAFYLDLFEGREVLPDRILKIYLKAFSQTETTVRYLAPLEFVDFSGLDMEFNGFQIRTFKKHELDSLLGSRINEVFYPWAATDLDLLHYYWFLCSSEKVHNRTAKRLSNLLDFNLHEFNLVRVEHVRFPNAVESALKPLVMFKWHTELRTDTNKKDGLYSGWDGFGLPFVISIDDDLLRSPSRMPNLDVLATEPIIDPDTDEEVGESPAQFIYLDQRETESFIVFVRHVESLIDPLPRGKWKFIDIALNFMRKAFFSDGLDQLLWHIAAVDALLGDSERGATKRIAKRLGLVLAEHSAGRKQIEEQFEELYKFRSTLVHGGDFSKNIYVGHLRWARDFARRALLWFLNCVNHVRANMPDVSNDLKREDILYQIDLAGERLLRLHESVRVGQRLQQTYKHFPFVGEWGEQ